MSRVSTFRPVMFHLVLCCLDPTSPRLCSLLRFKLPSLKFVPLFQSDLINVTGSPLELPSCALPCLGGEQLPGGEPSWPIHSRVNGAVPSAAAGFPNWTSGKGTNHHQSSSRCRQLRGVGGWMPAAFVEWLRSRLASRGFFNRTARLPYAGV